MSLGQSIAFGCYSGIIFFHELFYFCTYICSQSAVFYTVYDKVITFDKEYMFSLNRIQWAKRRYAQHIQIAVTSLSNVWATDVTQAAIKIEIYDW